MNLSFFTKNCSVKHHKIWDAIMKNSSLVLSVSANLRKSPAVIILVAVYLCPPALGLLLVLMS